MAIVSAPEIEEQVARAGGNGKRICSLCKKKDLALCHMGTIYKYCPGGRGAALAAK